MHIIIFDKEQDKVALNYTLKFYSIQLTGIDANVTEYFWISARKKLNALNITSFHSEHIKITLNNGFKFH